MERRERCVTRHAHHQRPATRSWRRPVAAIGLAVIAGAALVTALILSPAGAWLRGDSDSDHVLKAAIVDQLSLTFPNPAFIDRITDTLEQRDYIVDYFPGEDVTIDFYRQLPQGDYDLLLLRVHSTAVISRGEEDVESISLFTGQPYSRETYYEEQVQGRIGFAQYSQDSPKFFGITTEFIKESMEGDFDGTTVLAMGCQGLINERAAEAFAARGAGAFVAWDGLVSAEHTDAATESLLRLLVEDGRAAGEAVALTMAAVGPDPYFGSELMFIP
jgi:hypothetical protein